MTRIRGALGVLVVAFALIVGGCGGSGDESSEEELDEALSSLEEELAKNPPGPGLGEAAPPPADAAVWKTDFTQSLVSLDEFQSGGPPKDGIPAIDVPQFTRANEIDWIDEQEPVIVVEIDGETRAYPIQVLIWHEIANDQIGAVPIAVTFCPLCNTAIVFDRRLDGEVYSFGTTGKLRDSDLVMYDRKTESWWQQFSGDALVGELTGKKLEQLPVHTVAWSEFRAEHPRGLVLNRDTGFARNYGWNPYVGYDSIDSPPIFATRNEDDDRLPPKERVVYVEVGEEAFAVPFSSFEKEPTRMIETGRGDLVVRWKGGVASALNAPRIEFGRDVGSAAVTLDGRPVPFHEPFWFAVAAFRSDVQIVDG